MTSESTPSTPEQALQVLDRIATMTETVPWFPGFLQEDLATRQLNFKDMYFEQHTPGRQHWAVLGSRILGCVSMYSDRAMTGFAKDLSNFSLTKVPESRATSVLNYFVERDKQTGIIQLTREWDESTPFSGKHQSNWSYITDPDFDEGDDLKLAFDDFYEEFDKKRVDHSKARDLGILTVNKADADELILLLDHIKD